MISKDVICAAKKDSNSIPTPCMPDCFNVPWIIKREFKIINGCGGYVTYAYREACGTQDLEIIKMEYNPNCISNLTTKQMYKNLLYKIIKANVMNFHPRDSGCATTWRIVQSACWSYYYLYTITAPDPYSTGGGILDSSKIDVPCEGSECCMQRITVCRYQNPERIIISYNSPSTTSIVNCTNSWLENPFNNYIFPCEPKCEWLEDLYTEPMIIDSDDNSSLIQSKPNSIQNTYEIGVNVKVTDNLLSLMIKNQKSENAEFLIMDISGKIINKSNIKLNENNNYYNVRLNEFKSGTYLYSIIIDGLLIRSDKFIITK